MFKQRTIFPIGAAAASTFVAARQLGFYSTITFWACCSRDEPKRQREDSVPPFGFAVSVAFRDAIIKAVPYEQVAASAVHLVNVARIAIVARYRIQ